MLNSRSGEPSIISLTPMPTRRATTAAMDMPCPHSTMELTMGMLRKFTDASKKPDTMGTSANSMIPPVKKPKMMSAATTTRVAMATVMGYAPSENRGRAVRW